MSARKELRGVKQAQEAREQVSAQLAACNERCRVIDELRAEEYARREELMRAALVVGFTRAQVARMCGISTARVAQLIRADGS